MNILYTLDNNFVSQVGASICSVCENNKNKHLCFYIISDNITSENKNKFKQLVNHYNNKLSIIEIGDLHQYFDFKFDTLGWNSVVLARLLCYKILPQYIDRVLYLDGDTIVLSDLTELWKSDLKGRPIGACIEPTVDANRKQRLDMEQYPYFNSGVLLIDLAKCRNKGSFEKIIDFYRKNDGKLFAPDQDAINGCLKGNIQILSPKYNFSNTYIFYPYKILCKISGKSGFVDEDIYYDAINSPVIIHYLGEERPWRKGNHHRFRNDYVKYASMTPWGYVEELGWETYFKFWNVFNFTIKPFPCMRYKIINNLIPMVMKYRKRARGK